MSILKIVQIKPWCIKFDVDGQRYFLKEDNENPTVNLYKFNPIGDKGHYKTEIIGSRFGYLYLSDYISNPYKKGRTYKEIDLSQFWGQLACDGFGEILGMSKDDSAYFAKLKKIIECQNKITQLEDSLNKERSKLNKLQDEQEKMFGGKYYM